MVAEHRQRPHAPLSVLRCVRLALCGMKARGRRLISVKGGSLDRPVDLSTATHIWTSRKLEGVVVPLTAVQFAEEPD